MKIIIKTLTGKTMNINIAPRASVEELMEAIQKKDGIPPDQQRLIFNGEYFSTSFPHKHLMSWL